MLHQKKMRSAVLARLLAQATALSSPYLQRPTPAGVARATTPVFAVLAEPIPKVPVWHPTAEGKEIAARENLPGLSGLNGMAMLVEKSDIPSKGAVRTAVPDHCYVKDTKRSLKYALISLVEGLACLGVGFLIPLKLAALPLWIAYAMVTGCVWTGAWVIAHECGHNAFSNNRFIQDAVGYFFHSLLLVPYFSWQHSHAVHHQFTNHITKGETHVPFVIGGKAGIELPGGEHMMDAARFMGKKLHGVMQVVFHLVFGVRARLECPTRAAPNCCPAASRLRPPPLTMVGRVGTSPPLASLSSTAVAGLPSFRRDWWPQVRPVQPLHPGAPLLQGPLAGKLGQEGLAVGHWRRRHARLPDRLRATLRGDERDGSVRFTRITHCPSSPPRTPN